MRTLHNNGNVTKEYYEEGIFVGYRYFDTFSIPVRHGFGYGLSYTSFELRLESIESVPGKGIDLKILAENTGSTFSGSEVIQIYAACPQEKVPREFRRLIGFAKTNVLAPHESQTVALHIPLSRLASFDEQLPGWTVDAGTYCICIGSSLESSTPAAVIRSEELLLERLEHICPLKEELHELTPDQEKLQARHRQLLSEVPEGQSVSLYAQDVRPRTVTYDGAYEDTNADVRAFVDQLSIPQLIDLATGDIGKGQGSALGAAGSRVPGSAAQTSSCAEDLGLPDIVLADGPAGLRLSPTFRLINGVPSKVPFEKAIENGFLYRGEESTEGEARYQYCTAIPVGTLLAQTWNPETIRACGRAVAEEMRIFHVALWLAPGMNIHRNPLCGRNFEYYAEDPIVAGICASAMTEGVESVPGCGVTIKHFACNNQEDNRKSSDSILSERALREIYLKGFEIAVKAAHPAAIMTSYNLINGIHAANHYDLCTRAARNEWGFEGLIMTDWTTTNDDMTCTASGCMRAGNDIVMPGQQMDHDNLQAELDSGTLPLADLKRSVARTVNTIRRLTRI